MPARDMHFTFNTKLKVNKKTVLQFVEEYRNYIEDNFQEIKSAFNVTEINTDFLKQFIKELKGFSNVSLEDRESQGKERIVRFFIQDTLLDEIKDDKGIFGLKYLYDEWCYDACGHDDYYYFTYVDDVKVAKKTIKEVTKLVEKLGNLGVKVELKIEYDGKN